MTQQNRTGSAVLDEAQAHFAQREFTQCVSILDAALSANAFDPQTIAAARDLRFRADGQAQLQQMVQEALRVVAEAWQRADSAKMLAELARIPMDYPDADVRARRDGFARDLERLRVARGRFAAARSLLQHEEVEAAHRELTKAQHCDPLPDVVRAELDDLATRLTAQLAQQRQAELEAVHTALAEAHAALEAGELAHCRTALEARALSRDGVPETTRADLRELRTRLSRAAAAEQALRSAEALFESARYDESLHALQGLTDGGLPAIFADRRAVLEQRIHAAQTAELETQRDEMRGRLDDVHRALEHETDSDFAAILSSVANSPFADDAMRQRSRALAEEIEQQPRIRALLNEARIALGRRLEDVELVLEQLPAELRTWAASQRVDLLDQLAAKREAQRAALEERVTQVLNEIPEHLEEGEVSPARAKLQKVLPDLTAGSPPAKRHGELYARLAVVEQWHVRLQRLTGLLDAGDFQPVRVKCDEYQALEDLPAFAQRGLAQCAEEAVRRIDARRNAIGKQLSLLQAQIELRGRRIRNLDERLEHLVSDRYATAEHRRTADTIRKQFRSMPEPAPVTRSSGWRVTALIGVALGATSLAFLVPAILAKRSQQADTQPPALSDSIAAANENVAAVDDTDDEQAETSLEFATRPQPAEREASPSSREEPAPRTADLFTQALTRLATQMQQFTPADVAMPPTLRFEPANAFPAMLIMEGTGGSATTLTQVANADELASLDFEQQWAFSFFGAEEDSEREVANRGDDVAAKDEAAEKRARIVTAAERGVQLVDLDSQAEPFIEQADPEIEIVDGAGAEPKVVARFRFTADERPGAAFVGSGLFDVATGTLRADDATRAEFAEYLAEFRGYRADQTPALLEQALALPDFLPVDIADDYDQGPQLPLVVDYDGGRLLAIDADWNPDSLAFGVDLSEVETTLSHRIRELIANEYGEHFAMLEESCLPALAAFAAQGEADLFDVADFELDLMMVAGNEPGSLVEAPMTIELVSSRDDTTRVRIVGIARLTATGAVWDDFLIDDAALALLRQPTNEPITARETPTVDAQPQETPVASNTPDEDVNNANAAPTNSDADQPVVAEAAPVEVAANEAEVVEDTSAQTTENQPDAATSQQWERYLALSREKVAAAGNDDFVLSGDADMLATCRAWDAYFADGGATARPDVFCEYFLSDGDMIGVSWRVSRDENGDISSVSEPQEWTVFSAASLAELTSYDAYRTAYQDPRIGEALLGPLFAEQSIDASSRGDLGIVIAPVGVTWMTRWEQVRFTPREGNGFADARGGERIQALIDLLKNDNANTKQVAIWCVPSIVGRFRESPAGQEIGVGQIGSQRNYLLRFREYPGCVFAPVMSPTTANDPDWGYDLREISLANIGTFFWQRGWRQGAWRETPFVSFAVALTE